MEQFLAHPDKLLSDAQGGECAVVTQDGEPVFLAVPMGASLDSPGVRLELAASLFEALRTESGAARRWNDVVRRLEEICNTNALYYREPHCVPA